MDSVFRHGQMEQNMKVILTHFALLKKYKVNGRIIKRRAKANFIM